MRQLSLLFVLLCLFTLEKSSEASLRIGRGIYDITGPVNHTTLMGYGQLKQRAQGIHTRLRSRAFVFEQDSSRRKFALVSADLWAITQLLKSAVVTELRTRLGSEWSHENVMLSATHTHSGPGGYSAYPLFNFVNLGFDSQEFHTLVEGITTSIVHAHENLVSGRILINEGELLGASKNRSLGAYLKNPDADASAETNKKMTVLRFQSDLGQDLGMFSWFPVHQTSMSQENTLVSSDNKGHASYLFETLNGNLSVSSDGFVAAFANSEEGDVSPNVFDSSPSSLIHVSASLSDLEKTAAIGQFQFQKARELFSEASLELGSEIDVRHTWVEMPRFEVSLHFATDGSIDLTQFHRHRLCIGAIGESFAAGTDDGLTHLPGFIPGSTQTHPSRLPFYLDWARSLMNLAVIGKGSSFDAECQYPKPILMATGDPASQWTPNRLPFQLARIGHLAIIAVPGEMTTQAGKRLKEVVLKQLRPLGVRTAVIAGLANTYSLYITTPEEYQEQRYEGAATLFGPHTLSAYQEIYFHLAGAMRDGVSDPGLGSLEPAPVDTRSLKSFQVGVLWDQITRGASSIGSVIEQPQGIYLPGQSVRVVFQAGDPRNDLRTQQSYVAIQRWMGSSWLTVRQDWDPDVLFRWERQHSALPFGESRATIMWKIPIATEVGLYRVVHLGKWKALGADPVPYLGVSESFVVQAAVNSARE